MFHCLKQKGKIDAWSFSFIYVFQNNELIPQKPPMNVWILHIWCVLISCHHYLLSYSSQILARGSSFKWINIVLLWGCNSLQAHLNHFSSQIWRNWPFVRGTLVSLRWKWSLGITFWVPEVIIITKFVMLLVDRFRKFIGFKKNKINRKLIPIVLIQKKDYSMFISILLF